MRKLSVSILSDTHIDFYINQKDPNRIQDKQIEHAFDLYLDSDPEVDVLIIPGDLGHHNAQTLHVLKRIAHIFNYKKVFAVLGNHDEYATNKYKSRKRRKDLQEYRDPDGVLEILDGRVVKYKGIRFGGWEGCYDGTYLETLGESTDDIVDYWKYYMNDSKFQYRNDFMPKFLEERKKAYSIVDKVDVAITHYNPSNRKEHQLPKYAEMPSTCFYNWDGIDWLHKTTAKYLFFGHSHGRLKYTFAGTTCHLNALGYPGEPGDWQTLDLEFEDDTNEN